MTASTTAATRATTIVNTHVSATPRDPRDVEFAVNLNGPYMSGRRDVNGPKTFALFESDSARIGQHAVRRASSAQRTAKENLHRWMSVGINRICDFFPIAVA